MKNKLFTLIILATVPGFLLAQNTFPATGNVGIGTDDPIVDLEIEQGDTPAIRLDQTGESGWDPQTWDLAGNEANFFIRDATNGSTLPFRIRPGAPTNSIDIDDTGNVGIGLSSAAARLDVAGSIRLGNSEEELEGVMRWNMESAAFEGFDGIEWQSFSADNQLQSEIDELVIALGQLTTMVDQLATTVDSLETVISDCCGGVSVIENENQDSELFQNYPNPTSEMTTITFNLSYNVDEAQLLIFDLAGNLVFQQDINQRGFGSVIINAGTFSAGNYIYTLLGDGNVVGSKKLVIVE